MLILYTTRDGAIIKFMICRSSKGRGVAAIFDSQTENFPSQKGQSTKPSEAEFC